MIDSEPPAGAMRLRVQTAQVLAATVGLRLQASRLKTNIRVETVAENSAISRQPLHRLSLNHGKGTLINLIAVFHGLGELVQLSSLFEEVRLNPLPIIRLKGKKLPRTSGRSGISTDAESPGYSCMSKNSYWFRTSSPASVSKLGSLF
ncbi:XRE family transcriptional regulator [Pseudomonas sp. NPDC098747]|uniref:XRE family transcriptional regulator n=1 Tax=Pseudomonas sp. NPDC098747 TaxID=3364487 RepID=UPI00383B69E1